MFLLFVWQRNANSRSDGKSEGAFDQTSPDALSAFNNTMLRGANSGEAMTRSGYVNDWDYDRWATICWRGAVARAIKGKRGQAFLQEMLEAMATLPEKKLIDHDLQREGSVCAIGAVGKARGIDMASIDPEDRETVAKVFGIAPALAAEITFMNDEARPYTETPEERFAQMRKWIESELSDGPAARSIK